MDKIQENHQRYLERQKLFKAFHYDIVRERDFVIEKSEPVAGRILELGTGKGYFTVALANRGCRFTTVDISPEAQEFARMNVQHLGREGQVDFVIGNAERLRFPDGSFDIAFAINLVHHLDRPFQVVDELARVVVPGGRIILSDFSKEGFEIIGRIHQSEGRHHSPGKYSLNDLETYLTPKGFRVARFATACQDLMVVYL